MKILLNIFIFSLNYFGFAQEDLKDTTWFDKNWIESNKESASFYRVYKTMKDGYLVFDKYLNGQDQMVAEASSLRPTLIKNGHTTYFYKNGLKDSHGHYKINKKLGDWITYYDNGKDSSIVKHNEDGTTEVIRRSTKEVIFTIAEEPAEFPGGVVEMQKYIQTNLIYPNQCRNYNIGGKVFLKFVVIETGEIESVDVIKSSGNKLIDNEAARVISSMPKWKPAKMTGKEVKCYFNVPMNFALSDAPYFIFNISNKDKNYIAAREYINNNELNKAKEILNEDDEESLYLLGVINFIQNDKKKACKKFKRYINNTTDKSGQKAKLANKYLERNCA